jgi:hypothetical protein
MSPRANRPDMLRSLSVHERYTDEERAFQYMGADRNDFHMDNFQQGSVCFNGRDNSLPGSGPS